MNTIRPIEWVPGSPPRLVPGKVRFLDQTLLPVECRVIESDDLDTLWRAIRTLQIRGAPAIGIAAAMSVAAAAQHVSAESSQAVLAAVNAAADHLATARPTAVNLFWALDRMRRVAAAYPAGDAATLKERIAAEAVAIRDEDAAMCRAIGRHGADLLRSGDSVLTHCNAGALATAEYGTALAPIYAAIEQGRRISVYADETRPLLQGARLTAWELVRAGVEVTVICDNMAAQVMKEGRVKAVLVGADRIAANGDTANKIGTYGLAVLAKAHNLPFYVFAPTSTFDLSLATGAGIPIEERGREEITQSFGRTTVPHEARVYAPAFDVTPAALITAIVCEKGIARPAYTQSLSLMARE